MLGYLSADIICSEKGTDNVQGQISEHMFAPNGDYRVYYPSKLLRYARSFENWGIFNNYSTSARWICRGYYTMARRYEFYFRVAKQYFTKERSEWVKYCFCHEKIKFISSSRRVMFFLLYRHADDGVFDDFPKISDHLPKISEDFPKLYHINSWSSAIVTWLKR